MSGILRSLRVAAASVSGRTFKSVRKKKGDYKHHRFVGIDVVFSVCCDDAAQKSSMIGPNPSAADAAADASNSDGFIRKFELIFRNFPAATSLFGGALFGVRFLARHRLQCHCNR